MPHKRNDDRNEGRTDHLQIEGFQIDALLDRDQKMLSRVADERIAGGMYRRLVQAQREQRAHPARRWRWSLVCAGIAAIAAVVWIGMPRKTTAPGWEVVNRVTPGPATTTSVGVAETPFTGSNVKRTRRTRSHAGAEGVAVAHLAPGITPKQAVFPSNVAPDAQERLLMQLAENYPEQLPVIAKAIADDTQRQKDQRRAFEKWLKEGATR
jgi:hypothetical protein